MVQLSDDNGHVGRGFDLELSAERVVTFEEARQRAAEERAAGRTIVTTNGCFDIIHAGHVRCLEVARGFGDVLIVGLNTDDSVRRLKGPGRPVNSLEERMAVLAGLRAVSIVCPFEGDTPVEFVRAMRPHVHVKGGDWLPDPRSMPEMEPLLAGGGRVEIVPTMGGYSTTRLLERIEELLDAGLLT